MNYICVKRFKGAAIDGNVDVAVGTELTCENKIIKRKTKKICVSTSDNAHTYFMRNDDGNGMQRGELIEYIITALASEEKHEEWDGENIESFTISDEKHNKRWETIMNDPICQAYRRPEHSDVWIWNHAFFNTTVETLTYIKDLVMEEEDHDEGK